MKKLSPSVKLRKEVSEFIERLQDVDSAEDVLTQLVQLSTQLITQEGLEAHQRDHLGVDRYERVRVGEGIAAVTSRAIWIRLKVVSRSPSLRSGVQMSPIAAPSTTSCVATQRWFSVWPPRCMPAACHSGHRGRFHRRAGSLPAQSQQGQRGDRGFSGNNTRLSRTVTSVTFRSCACFWTGSTNRCRTHGITREAILCAWASLWTAGRF